MFFVRGNLRERSQGVWELTFELPKDPLTNKRRRRSKTFHGTKREAARELRRLITDSEEGRLTGKQVLVSDLIVKWLELAEGELAVTTFEEYKRLVDKRIGPAIGGIALTELTTPRLDDFYRALTNEAGLGPSSIHQVHSVIRRFLKQGVKWGWIKHNVAVNASPPPLKPREIQPPPIDKIRALVREATEKDPVFGMLIRVAIATGLRRSELCGLKWDDIDLARRKMRVKRAVVVARKKTHQKPTKTRATRRLTLDLVTVQLLAAHKEHVETQARQNGAVVADDGFVFSYTLDCSEPIKPYLVTDTFRNLPSNGRTIRLHDLRHAHATQLLGNGIDIPTVAGRLGHATPSTTLNFYAHALEENDETAADIMGDLL